MKSIRTISSIIIALVLGVLKDLSFPHLAALPP